MSDIRLIYTTFASREQARELIREALDQGLIACANLYAMESHYSWQGERCEDTEYAALLKTSPEKEAALRTWLESRHPYEVPCILSWGAAANPAYGDWIRERLFGGGDLPAG
jgi:periplasmic divalent cation tolerance protein